MVAKDFRYAERHSSNFPVISFLIASIVPSFCAFFFSILPSFHTEPAQKQKPANPDMHIVINKTNKMSRKQKVIFGH